MGSHANEARLEPVEPRMDSQALKSSPVEEIEHDPSLPLSQL